MTNEPEEESFHENECPCPADAPGSDQCTNCISTDSDFEATVQMVMTLFENIARDMISSL